MRRLANFVVLGTLLFLSFEYLADFPTKQSLVLAVVITSVILFLLTLIEVNHRETWDFHPFSVIVRPKLVDLLRDYKLVKSDTELRSITEILEPTPYFFIFVFTVLRPEPGWSDFRGLTYLDQSKGFVSEVDFRAQVGKFRNETSEPPLWNIRSARATIYMKWGVHGGYDLGLIIPHELWEQICVEAPYLDNLKNAVIDDSGGSMRLIVATLPYLEFDVYWYDSRPGVHERSYRMDLYRMEKDRDAKLAENGWKREAFEPRYQSQWTRLEHKYFSVEHRGI